MPLVASLRVAKEAVEIQTLSDSIGFAIEEVQRGASLAKSLSGNNLLFPASVIEMITVAEETGRLDKELQRLAVAFEADLDRQLRNAGFAGRVPAMPLFIMAGLIGTVVLGHKLLPVVFNLAGVDSLESGQGVMDSSSGFRVQERRRGIMRMNRKNRHAFTLIELLLVLVILGVLAAIVVPKMTGA